MVKLYAFFRIIFRFIGHMACFLWHEGHAVRMSTSPSFLVARLNRRYCSHAEIWEGISEVAAAADWPYPIDEKTGSEHRRIDEAACMGLMAWIWNDADRNVSYPIVNFSNTSGPLPDFGNLLNDDEAVGRMAAKHFLKAGYSHFFALGMPQRTFSVERVAGFQKEVASRCAGYGQAEVP